jgi:hypothetical protein
LRQRGEADLDRTLRTLEAVDGASYREWTRAQQLAFWINAYNAYTVRLILDHYPVRSIRSIGFWPLAAFRTSFIPMKALTGRQLSLNDIEHEVLRKRFREPRIHFAAVCASKGCPTLRSEAYRATELDRQLDESARAFLRDPSKNRFEERAATLYLSSIFKWFREDFETHVPG